MPRHTTAADAVATVARLSAARAGTFFVGVDGYGGAGKTTLAEAMAAAVPGAHVVHADDFAAPSVPEWDFARFQAQVADPLLAGRPGRYQRWDWDRDVGAEWHDVPTGGLVVVEGVSSTRREVRVPWALTVWVDTPRDERLRRAVERDGPAKLRQWLDVWLPQEDAYVARERPRERVDLIVAGV